MTLRFFLLLCKKNKLRFIIALLSGIFFGGFAYLLTEKTWQGEFQIVIDLNQKKDSGYPLPSKATLNSKATQGLTPFRQKDALNTEVGILKSPSVLMPIFKYVKTEKIKDNKKFETLKFKDWYKSQFDIKLIKATSILNLTYRDNSKELIKEVLNRISEAYQEYSKKDRLLSLNNGIKYLNNQIEIYNLKSLQSLKNAQSFAINEDLTPLKSLEGGDDEILNVINIEAIRIKAGNQLRNLKEQEKQLINIQNDPEALIFFAKNVQGNTQIFNILKKLSEDLIIGETKYTPDDIRIKELKENKAIYTELLRKETSNFIKAMQFSTQSRLDAATRPKGVIIKYKELLREARRDKSTLVSLENDKRLLSLEVAKYKEPWKLITEPTVFDQKYSPSLKKYLFFSIILFFFITYLSTFPSISKIINSKKYSEFFKLF